MQPAHRIATFTLETRTQVSTLPQAGLSPSQTPYKPSSLQRLILPKNIANIFLD